MVNSSEYDNFWRRLNKGEFFSGQFKRSCKNGQTIWLGASYNPVYSESTSSAVQAVRMFAGQDQRRL